MQPRADAFAEPEKILTEHPDTNERIETVLALAEGFDSPYGLELLSTVHWVAARDSEAANDLDLLTKQVQAWSARKERLFTERHIQIALQQLTSQDHNWLAAAVSS